MENKKSGGYMMAIPDKNNPKIIRYQYVSYKQRVLDFDSLKIKMQEKNEKFKINKMNKKTLIAEKRELKAKEKKSKQNHQQKNKVDSKKEIKKEVISKPKESSDVYDEKEITEELSKSVQSIMDKKHIDSIQIEQESSKDSNYDEDLGYDEEVRKQIAKEVQQIMVEQKYINGIRRQDAIYGFENNSSNQQNNKKSKKYYRYTNPKKDRKLSERLVNMHYFKGDKKDYDKYVRYIRNCQNRRKDVDLKVDDWEFIQDYEDARKDPIRSALTKIKYSLASIALIGMLTTSAVLVNEIRKDFNELKEKISYTPEHQVPVTEKMAQSYFLKMKDQEYLNMITDGSHEEWEALPDEIKEWIRDPDVVKAVEEKINQKKNNIIIIDDTEETESQNETSDIERD